MPKSYLAAVLCLLFIAGAVIAAQPSAPKAETDAISTPRLINYQGKLTDADGDPLTGTYDMAFAIYNVEGGGIAAWSETQTDVVVTEGIFNVILGSVTPVSGLPEGPDCYLGVTVETDPEISPRTRLASVPYATMAQDADHAVTADGADLAANALNLGGVPAASYATQSWVTAGYAPLSHAHSAADITSGTLPIARGGTNNTSYTQGGALYYNGSAIASTGQGTSGQFLTSQGAGAPTWTTISASNYWADAGTYVYPNVPANSNVRIYDASQTYGVYAQTTTGNSYGVYGYGYYTSTARPYGVCGYGYNSYGSYNYGGIGVYGYGYGYYGQTYGVYGYATVSSASSSYPVHGVYGFVNTQYGRGVTGYASGSYSYGLYGYATSSYSYGVYGYGYYYGVYGYSSMSSGYGVYGVGYYSGVGAHNTYYGYYSRLAYMSYKVYGSGSVSTYILDESGDERVLHCPETPEVLFEDVGSNQLVNGYRRVNIDPLLLRGIVIDKENPLRVFVTPTDEVVPLAVRKGDTYFEVLGPAGSNVAFDWRIVANRKGFQNLRFENRGRPEDMRGTVDRTPIEVEPELKKTPYVQ